MGGVYHQCCGPSWNRNSHVLERRRCEFSHWSNQLTYLLPRAKSVSHIKCELLTIRFTYCFSFAGVLLDTSVTGLWRKSYKQAGRGRVYKQAQFIEQMYMWKTSFLTLALKGVPVKTLLLSLLSLSKFIHNRNTFFEGWSNGEMAYLWLLVIRDGWLVDGCLLVSS